MGRLPLFLLAALLVLPLSLTDCGSSPQSTSNVLTPAEKACGNQGASTKGYEVTSWSPIAVQPVVAHPTATATLVVNAIKALCIVTIGDSPATTVRESEHEELEATGAFTTDPIRFLLVGDSVAVTASVGLAVGSTQRYGVKVIDGGILGCDLDIGPSILEGVTYGAAPNVDCGPWPRIWTGSVARFRPEVVGLILGRFELADHIRNGQVVNLGQPAWDAHLVRQLDQAIAIFTAHGAHVVIFTFPYIDPPLEQPNGDLWPEDLPSRIDIWNQLLRQVVTANPKTTTLIDLNRILDPDGHFTYTVDGITVRWPDDGVHISKAGGLWLQPQILPEVAELGLQVRESAAASAASNELPGLIETFP